MPATIMATDQSVTGPTTAMSVIGVNKASIYVTGQFSGIIFLEATQDTTGTAGWKKYWWSNHAGKYINQLGDAGNINNVNYDTVLYCDVEPVAYIRLNATALKAGSFSAIGYVDSGGKTVEISGRTATKTVTIPAGQSLSNEVDIEGYQYIAFYMPATWDAAPLTFETAPVSGGTFEPVQDDAGTEVNIPVAAGKTTTVDINALKLAPLRFIKIRSGTAASPVNQTAARDIIVILKN